MSSKTIELPPFRVMDAALRKTTERLASEVASPTASPPSWSELEWTIARAVASMQGTAAILADKLRWAGPPQWQSFLSDQHEQYVLRDARLGETLQRIGTELRQAGIRCVALKGSAIRALGLYAPGQRSMADIDLLVRPDDVRDIDPILVRVGFVKSYVTRRHLVYQAPQRPIGRRLGEYADNPLKIEVHTEVAEVLPVRRVEITDDLWPARLRPGINAYPSPAALMLHLLLHAAGCMRSHAMRQIQIHDVAALARRFSDKDWRELLGPPVRSDRRWWMFPPLSLTERYYPSRIPEDVLTATRSQCHRALRAAAVRQTLSDVSWSNLRIEAFPGLEWSRTLSEALRFMLGRAIPGRVALTELGTTLQSQPQLYDVPWYGIAHGRRIFRWLFSNPPRVQTVTTIMAALETGRPPHNGSMSAT